MTMLNALLDYFVSFIVGFIVGRSVRACACARRASPVE
jgi:hypothetical protein